MRNAENQLATTLYDTAGQVLAVVEALDRRITFGYDRWATVEDAEGRVTTMICDVAGR